MNEYVNSAIGKERSRYDHFRRATGRDYDYLLNLHEEAVRILDSNMEGLPASVSEGWMAVSPRVIACLTDMVLQRLALGYEIQRPRPEEEFHA